MRLGVIYFKNIIALDVIVFLGGCSGHGTLGEGDDTVVRCTDTYLIFGTNHTERLFATDFRFLDSETFITTVQCSTYSSHNNVLAGGNVSSTAHNLSGVAIAEVYCGDVQVVAVGVIDTSEHLAYYKTFKTTFYGLNLFNSTGLKTY